MVQPSAQASPSSRRVQWEFTACPLCQANTSSPLLQVATSSQPYRLVRCRVCEMVYLNPRPAAESIAQFYPDDYACYQAPLRRGWRAWMKKQRARLGRGESLTGLPMHGAGQLLDFGCGSGWFAHRMQERGWNVTAMDFSPHAARRVREAFGLSVLVGTLPHAEIQPASFDMITMGQVLEHVYDPRAIIAAAARALKPGGRLVISVPNLASWGFRTFGAQWWPLDLPRHLLHFTPVTLQRLVEIEGLQVQELRFVPRTSWMEHTLSAVRNAGNPQRGVALLAAAGRIRLFRSLLTRWTVSRGQGDCMLLTAARPDVVAPAQDGRKKAASAA